MASSMLPTNPVVLRAGNNTADDRKPKKNMTWWSPLFGFSSEPDYINSDAKPETIKPAKVRFEPVLFTEEKAKQLRRLAPDATSCHEMYHSVIATRLATDFSDRAFDA